MDLAVPYPRPRAAGRPSAGTVAAAERRERAASTGWIAAARVALWPFLLSRVWVALFAYFGHARRPYLAPVPGGWEGVANWWLNPWTTYDSQWFIRIATAGYESLTASFFPLYSLLLNPAGPDPVRMAAWGFLISNLAFAAGLVVLYRLTALDYDERTGRAALWLLAFFPTAAIFSAVYSESIFLLFLVAAFYALRRDAWGWTGVWAFLAALTRNSG